MPVNARWVIINGETLLSITLPGHQHVTIDRPAGWKLLMAMRYAMRDDPNGKTGDYPGKT